MCPLCGPPSPLPTPAEPWSNRKTHHLLSEFYVFNFNGSSTSWTMVHGRACECAHGEEDAAQMTDIAPPYIAAPYCRGGSCISVLGRSIGATHQSPGRSLDGEAQVVVAVASMVLPLVSFLCC